MRKVVVLLKHVHITDNVVYCHELELCTSYTIFINFRLSYYDLNGQKVSVTESNVYLGQ